MPRDRNGGTFRAGERMNTEIMRAIEKLESFMETVNDALELPRESAEFVHAVILATGARRGLEIGTSYGYSALWAGAALAKNGGNLVTIDNDPRKTEAARETLRKAGLSRCVELRAGAALDVLATLPGPFDYVLNDADKENCRAYVELIADRLSDRAVVLTDNTVSHADQLEPFITWIRHREDFISTGLPFENGMEMSIKKATR
jgi:predicted O-methyltransferase YrrM